MTDIRKREKSFGLNPTKKSSIIDAETIKDAVSPKKHKSSGNNFVFYWLLTLSIVLMLFSGCATTTPMTKSIFNEVGGTKNTKNFQYYVSNTITLKLVAESKKTTVEGGQLVRSGKTSREKIVITKSLPGIVRDNILNSSTGDYQLVVAFEDYDGNPVLWFGQSSTKSDGKYYLLYDDTKNNIIEYGNSSYVVNYAGNGIPYLLIKMKQSSKKSNKARKVKGLKLGK